MGAELFSLPAHEDAELDTSRIHLLRASLGDQRCREVVEEVVFHLTDRLALLQAALERDAAGEAQTLALRLAGLSEQIGLADFARVARDLGGVLLRADEIAAAAVAARLIRLGEDSLCTVMTYADECAL